jgi:hypothetical protein
MKLLLVLSIALLASSARAEGQAEPWFPDAQLLALVTKAIVDTASAGDPLCPWHPYAGSEAEVVERAKALQFERWEHPLVVASESCEHDSGWVFPMGRSNVEDSWRQIPSRTLTPSHLLKTQAQCLFPTATSLVLREEAQQMAWLDRDTAMAIWPLVERSAHAGMGEIADVAFSVFETRVIQCEVQQRTKHTASVFDVRAQHRVNALHALRRFLLASRTLARTEEGPLTASTLHDWWVISSQTHTCLDGEARLNTLLGVPHVPPRAPPAVSPDDLQAWAALLPLWLREARAHALRGKDFPDSRGHYDWHSVPPWLLKRQTFNLSSASLRPIDRRITPRDLEKLHRLEQEQSSESQDPPVSNARFTENGKDDLLLRATRLCERAGPSDPCGCPIVSCDTEEAMDGSTVTRIRALNLEAAPSLGQGPLPMELALLTGLRSLRLTNLQGPALCNPQTQAVLRSLPLDMIVLSFHLEAGPLDWPVQCDSAACQRAAGQAKLPLRDTILGMSLRGLELDVYPGMPRTLMLFGARGETAPTRARWERVVEQFQREAPVEGPQEGDDALSAAEQAYAGTLLLSVCGRSPQVCRRASSMCRDEFAHSIGEARFWKAQAEREAQGQYSASATARVKLFGDAIVWPEELEWVCSLHSLLRFETQSTAAGLPSCFGELTELRELDVRGGYFGLAEPSEDVTPGVPGPTTATLRRLKRLSEATRVPERRIPPLDRALPGELDALAKLTSFVGFQQALSHCSPDHVAPPPSKPLTEPLGRHVCLPIMESIENALDGPAMSILVFSALPGKWRCPEGGAWSPRFDEMDQPWWKWRSIERFWVDGNRFRGPIPESIASLWPHMRTIDLYSNTLNGSVPASIAQLKHLRQLQLQDNWFAGSPPSSSAEAFFSRQVQPDIALVDLRMNPSLTGMLGDTVPQLHDDDDHDDDSMDAIDVQDVQALLLGEEDIWDLESALNRLVLPSGLDGRPWVEPDELAAAQGPPDEAPRANRPRKASGRWWTPRDPVAPRAATLVEGTSIRRTSGDTPRQELIT